MSNGIEPAGLNLVVKHPGNDLNLRWRCHAGCWFFDFRIRAVLVLLEQILNISCREVFELQIPPKNFFLQSPILLIFLVFF